jgi:CSLREA domain-containing protein/uncharacterized repeat protein (TIGR01451 family)
MAGLGLALALLACALVFLAVPMAYAAGTITVNTTVDEYADPGPDSGCSLREAIKSANDNVDFGGCTRTGTPPYTINLPDGTYKLTHDPTPGTEDDNAEDDLDVRANISIVAVGPGVPVIDGNLNDRVLHIDPAGTKAYRVNITGVTITKGKTDGNGGGIFNDGSSVTLSNSTVYSNTTSQDGGGIRNKHDATLTIISSSIYSNTSRGGGGIDSSGTLTITGSTICSNTTTGNGGGIKNEDSPMTITGSTLSGNRAYDGGGIYNDGWPAIVLLTNSTVFSNTATGDSGGVHNLAKITVVDSTFSLNMGKYGGAISNHGTATISRSTLSDNRATIDGGGIYNDGVISVTNSTLSHNWANGHGGGFRNEWEIADLCHVTIADNTADYDNTAGGDGGGIYDSEETLRLKNAIVAGNTDRSGEAPDCWGPKITIFGHNMVQSTLGCIFAGDGVNIGGTNPLLDPLADNGGATETRALRAGSLAIDAVTDCTDLMTKTVATDQRGVLRPQGPACDIGAYEGGPDLSVTKTVTPLLDVSRGGLVTYTVVLGNNGLADAAGVQMSDTFPAQVDFARWVPGGKPAGANVAGDELTWGGLVPTADDVTFAWVATHTGNYSDVVTNTAAYTHSSGSGSDDAVFTVAGPPGETAAFVYLPIILRNAQP